MNEIFVNLKRFDVPKSMGGVCPVDDPVMWIESVIKDSIALELGSNEALRLVYLLPESLIPAAMQTRATFPSEKTQYLGIGSQGIHWEDVAPGKNFGAFTTFLPAASAKNLGCDWAIIGHSEERKGKRQVMGAFQEAINTTPEVTHRANAAVDHLVQAEVQNALKAGINVLLCVGESAEERGEGNFEEQKPRIESVLESQLVANLSGIDEMIGEQRVVIGYEPIWAIGPGKTPPGEAYISFVSAFIQNTVKEKLGLDVGVVYGGGLKEENAEMIAGIKTIGGGLVALTRFVGDIGFDVPGLKGIIDKYLAYSE